MDVSGDKITKPLNLSSSLPIFSNTETLAANLSSTLGLEVATGPAEAFPDIVARHSSETSGGQQTIFTVENERVARKNKQDKHEKEANREAKQSKSYHSKHDKTSKSSPTSADLHI